MTDKELLQLVEWIAGEDNPKDIDKKLSAIYRFVHGFREDACCKGVHQDWRDEGIKLLAELKKLGEIK